MNSLVPKAIFLEDPVHKTKESPSNSQDSRAINSQLNRFAVADGIGGSFYPADWAKLLVSHFVNDNTPIADLQRENAWQSWLMPIQQKWREIVGEKVKQHTEASAYHLRNSYRSREPAGATFVGLQINQSEWQAMIIGDSCLLHLTTGNLIGYSLQHSGEFDNTPDHFISIDNPNQHAPKFHHAEIHDGDYFFIATDALSKWLLRQHEMGEAVWKTTWHSVVQLRTWDDLYQFATKARQDPLNPLEDDDITLIVIEIMKNDGLQQLNDFFSTPNDKPAEDVRPSPVIPQLLLQPPSLEKPPFSHSTPPPSTAQPQESSRILLEAKRHSTNAVFVSLIALFVSVISICLSAINPYSFFTFKSEPTPISTSTPEKKAPSLIAPTAASALLPILLPLSPNTIIYERPDINSKQLFLVTGQTQVTLTASLTNAGQTWAYIELDLWLSASENR